MRYRALDADGDMTFGHNGADFLVNTPAAVAQAVKTRLLLFTGEWFLDVTEGTAWKTRILGKNGAASYNPAIRSRILGTQGVTEIVAGSYTANVVNRRLSVTCAINTLYGKAQIAVVI